MSELKGIILRMYQKYPLMTIKDLVKLIYQNEFAGGHLISQPANSLAYLEEEYKIISTSKKKRFEEIGNRMVRIYLDGLEEEGISLEIINQWFVQTSNQHRGNLVSFEAKLEEIIKLCEERELPFEGEEVKAYLRNYKKAGYPVVSHSEIYREAYKPHYRVIHADYQMYYEVFLAIEKLLKTKETISIAIEGNSGSGKSYLAKWLRQTYNCNVFHMDDFFLSPERKTKERLSEPGGNVDYERFEEEVIDSLKKQKPFQYQIFDCKQGKLTQWVEVTPKNLNIIEGVYSLHPRYKAFYDLKVFLYTSEAVQHERILKRNGSYMLNRFKEEWIPLENQYFDAFKIKEQSDYVIDTSKPKDEDVRVQ